MRQLRKKPNNCFDLRPYILPAFHWSFLNSNHLNPIYWFYSPLKIASFDLMVSDVIQYTSIRLQFQFVEVFFLRFSPLNFRFRCVCALWMVTSIQHNDCLFIYFFFFKFPFFTLRLLIFSLFSFIFRATPLFLYFSVYFWCSLFIHAIYQIVWEIFKLQFPDTALNAIMM